MFKQTKDKQVIGLTIEFNLSAISEWLNSSGQSKGVDKKNNYRNTKDPMFLRYYIDVLPNGQMSDMYFHRQKGIVSNNLGGIDYLENVSDDLKRFLKNTKIEILHWDHWRDFIALDVNRKLILSVPINEIAELQELVSGADTLTKKGWLAKYFEKKQKIKVPISFDSDNQPKEFMEVWRSRNSPQSIRYKNALATVSASTSNAEVTY